MTPGRGRRPARRAHRTLDQFDVGDLDEPDRGAEISEDGQYRYSLWRTWDVGLPTVAFIMLNPSTADGVEDDPTIRRCIGLAKSWGYGTLVVGNLFALRTKEPEDLYDHQAPVGPENDDYLREIVADDPLVVAAWGHHGGLDDRGREVVDLLDVDLFALDTTQEGHPAHPLFQPADADLEPFSYGGSA